MTPTEINDMARGQYNAVGDTFFVEADMLKWMTQACQELASKCLTIRKVFTTTSVSGTQEIALPTNIMGIKRVTYDGEKLSPYSMREDDSYTARDSDITDIGTPIYYFTWDTSIWLRPTPDDAKTIKIYAFTRPQALTSTATLEVPEDYHANIADYITWRMCIQDSNLRMGAEFRNMWQNHIYQAKILERKKLRMDAFTNVQETDLIPMTTLGTA